MESDVERAQTAKVSPWSEVSVQRVWWFHDVPFVRVSTEFDVCVLHRSFLQRYQIGPGSVLRLWRDRAITQVVSHGPPLSLDTTHFGRWFAFRQLDLPRSVLLRLFRAGIETQQDLMRQKTTVDRIPGIGPVTKRRIGRIQIDPGPPPAVQPRVAEEVHRYALTLECGCHKAPESVPTGALRLCPYDIAHEA
jgi:hypothetical protein